MRPIIRAAVDSGIPPLALLLDQPGRKRGRLDGILIKALYLADSYEVDGHPIWLEDSDAIYFESRHRDIRSAAVVERASKAEGEKKHPTPGRRFYAVPRLRPGHTWPTRKEWIERRAGGGERPHDEVVDMRRVEEAEERARIKAESNPDVERIVAEFERRFNSANGRMDTVP